jgi:hypothetical protein
MPDESNLADSAFEIIHNTDTESQDGQLTESTSSLPISRSDDVESLDGTESHYNSETDDEEALESSHASSIRYADQALQSPSPQLPASTLHHGSSTDGSGVMVGSIEFQEDNREHKSDSTILLEKISVKHAIKDFNEEESAALARTLGLPNAPKRLVVTVRQTMSQSYLSTEKPLRVLYVGRAEAQRSIILKVCNAIWVSPKNSDKDADYFNRHREGLYNIIPISSFGPNPELDLMEASHYQIKVEHCTSAHETIYEGSSFPNDTVYSITLEHDRTYTSSFSSSGSRIQPKWDLPHIAIFYCSEKDDAESTRTRDAAWAFMKRHGVPVMFIAEQQMFKNNSNGRHWNDYIDEDTPHLCLESRDSEAPMSPQRFPIDYNSFADIDARQMNRNLTYLTGRSKSDDVCEDQASSNVFPGFGLFKNWASLKENSTVSFQRLDLAWWIFFCVFPILLPIFGSYLIDSTVGSWRSEELSGLHAVHSTGVCPTDTNSAGFTVTKQPVVATTTTTVVINVTSTKTIQVSHAKPSTSALASALSFAGFLSDKPSDVPSDTIVKTTGSTKQTLCSVRIHSPTEFLIEIPNKNKAIWLAQGAINIDVYRGDVALRTKISSVDEGVLVELSRKEAHGLLNISVVTNRRPKINETFQLDFGKASLLNTLEEGLHRIEDGVGRVCSKLGDASQALGGMVKVPNVFMSTLEHASESLCSRAADSFHQAAYSVRKKLSLRLETAKEIRKEVGFSILQAQITSRLWWLKMQGKMDEYAAYKRNASRLLKMKFGELRKGKALQEKDTPVADNRGFLRLFPNSHRTCKGECVKGVKEPFNPHATDGGNVWLKFMGRT